MFPFFIVDLTHAIHSEMPSWSGSSAIEYKTLVTHEQCTHGTRFLAFRYDIAANAGTHIDAPLHCVPGGASVAEIASDSFVRPLVVIRAQKNGRDAITCGDIFADEAKNGAISSGSVVCFDTGWAKRFNDPVAYRNCATDGTMAFPFIDEEAARYLADKNCMAVGIDTLSPDCPVLGSYAYPVHDIFLSRAILIIENVAHLDTVPARGAFIGIFPIKIENGSESPVRLVAFVPRDS
jgi:kynurenine formamidase